MLAQISVTHQKIVDRVSHIREEWEATGENLLEVNAPVGLLLYDFCKALDFTPHEIADVIGEPLLQELQG